MAAREILEEIGEEHGWSKKTMLDLCLDYIDNQDSDDAFEDFLKVSAEDESLEHRGSDDDEEEPDDPLPESITDEGDIAIPTPKKRR